MSALIKDFLIHVTSDLDNLSQNILYLPPLVPKMTIFFIHLVFFFLELAYVTTLTFLPCVCSLNAVVQTSLSSSSLTLFKHILTGNSDKKKKSRLCTPRLAHTQLCVLRQLSCNFRKYLKWMVYVLLPSYSAIK